MTQALSERLSRAAADLPPDSVSLQSLAAAHGPAAQGTLLILLSAPCVLPVPGVGSVLGWGLLAIAIALWRQDPLQLQSQAQLPTKVADIQLPRLWAERVLKLLARFYAASGRMARTRLTHLTEGGAQRWLAAKVGLMAILIVLPIPLGNLFPALCLMLVGMGFGGARWPGHSGRQRDGSRLGAVQRGGLGRRLDLGVGTLGLDRQLALTAHGLTQNPGHCALHVKTK